MSSGRPSFGVEEEFLLLDATTGSPVNCAAEVVLAMAGECPSPDREFLSSQLETATPVCFDAAEAESALMEFRRVGSGAARSCGCVLAGTGLPPVGGETEAMVTPKHRYRRIAEETGRVAKHQYSTGTHVHVAIPSLDAGVEVLARIARWSPVLLAMTANSPLWSGESTGFASWRHVLSLSWPVVGYPQGFRDGTDYERSVTGLIDSGIVPDTGMISWIARLSANYPTIELRVADAQLDACDTVAFAVLVRALVARALSEAESGDPSPRYQPGLINSANWFAARNGLGSELVDPLTLESLPAFEFVDRMLASVADELRRFGDADRVARYSECLRRVGDPASRQLSAFASGGVGAVVELFICRPVAAGPASKVNGLS